MNTATIIILTAIMTASLIWVIPRLRSLLPGLKGLDPYHFENRVELLGKSIDGAEIDVLAVGMRGRITTPCDSCDTNVSVEIMDITEGLLEPLRVLCTQPNMRRAEGMEFFFQTHNGIIPGRDAILPQWRTVLELSCDVLRFPKRGQRLLQFTTRISQVGTGRELAVAKTTLNYFVAAAEGYLDFEKRMEQILAGGYILAHQAAGNQPNPEQQKLIENWLNGCVNHAAANLTIDVHKVIPSETPEQAVDKACEILLQRADTNYRFGLIEVCVKIAAAAQPVSRPLQDWLKNLSERLELPADRFQAIYQKYLPLEAQENPDPACVLGIDPTLPVEETLKRLTEEYRKWNSRVNHPDAKVRQQADKMLSYLTEVRSRLLVQSKA
jgi:2C-methyl-D-erythritol 2,4-cyclodiphosphate synthase